MLPDAVLEDGYNTRQAINYNYRNWRDFFNDRQLLALGKLQRAIAELPDRTSRDALLLLFSGVLEFNNLFASYKGEGTGAVRHMFSHHIGESWDQGKVVLSRDDVEYGLSGPEEICNVVVHEFAHQLDHASGDTNGAPWIANHKKRRRWAKVMQQASNQQCDKIQRGEPNACWRIIIAWTRRSGNLKQD